MGCVHVNYIYVIGNALLFFFWKFFYTGNIKHLNNFKTICDQLLQLKQFNVYILTYMMIYSNLESL